MAYILSIYPPEKKSNVGKPLKIMFLFCGEIFITYMGKTQTVCNRILCFLSSCLNNIKNFGNLNLLLKHYNLVDSHLGPIDL